ncbi:MAG TPA: Gfo/Idh/MocA family oxidoreductase [Abditibacteriaceae bacterium]|jgi:UDP-2-acetamido-3-amino-2,3-dideoxy-glucuronate N-acetyltransferase
MLAVVGSGYWGKNLVRNFNDLGVLAAICDSSPERQKTLLEQYPNCRIFSSYQEVLEDKSILAVAIATPAETHADLIRKALLAGKDVYVEKPLCLSVATGRELIDLAQEQGRILMVGHLLWYHPAVLKLKELIDSGELGRLQYIYSNRLNLGKIRREENILWSFAPHDISVILGLLGEMPDTITAQGGNYLHQQIADVTVSLLSFPSGVKAHIFVSWLHPFKEQKLVVVGDRKMAVLDDVEKENKLVLYPHSIEWVNQAPVANKAQAEIVPLDWQEPLRAECQHFLDCVKERKRPRTDGEEALRVLTVLQRCQDALEVSSAAPGSTVDSTRPAPVSKPEKASFFVHESAFVDDGVEIDEGTSIWHVSHIIKGTRIGKGCKIGQNVVIGPNAVIGDGVKIQNNVSVYEGVTLEDGVFCGPSMVFTNVFNPRSEVPRMHELRPTLVKRGATLGANCTVVCGVTIGQYALVGAGAVITKDVPDYALVTGVPARVTGWVSRHGNKLDFEDNMATCPETGRRYQKTEPNVVTELDYAQ